ncbi:MAG: response regulator transcription factor [Kiloniellales bacterium]|jgi:two-component system OmpR family response regulator|nr:response regulator transcription factor [Kiloniellales bacterium]
MNSRRLDDPNGKSPRESGSKRILVVDDDPAVCRLLVRILSSEGFDVETVSNGAAMWRALETSPCDLVILDLRLPGDEDGLTLARQLRVRSNVALIMLTGRGENVDKVVGLELGADDYVTKPFDPRELLARIRSVLRRLAPSRLFTADAKVGSDVVDFSGWSLDLHRRELTSPEGKLVKLTSYEFELLAVLAQRPGRTLSRDQILDLIANRNWDPTDRSIDVLVGKLRRKLNDDPRQPRLIKTVRSVGYMFASPPERSR